jgi:glyoxylase-like metal-dependent hydrolase (beta-lactamase superfamily II)
MIVRIRLGTTSAYVIREPVPVLIDTGMVGQDDLLRWKLRRAGVELRDIALIVVTHAHSDHAGCLARLRASTDAAIACSCDTMEHLRSGTCACMRPRTVVARAVLPILSRFASYPAVDADVGVSEAMTLAPFGIDGTLLTTPGHTRGCLSVLVGHDAVVGDLVSGRLGRPRTPSVPLLLEDEDSWLRSVRLLLDRGARTFHPAHGGPFEADRVARLL